MDPEFQGRLAGAAGWPSLECESSQAGPPCHTAALWHRAAIYCILVFKLQYNIDSLLFRFRLHSPSLSRSASLCLSSSSSICLVSLSTRFLTQSIILHGIVTR